MGNKSLNRRYDLLEEIRKDQRASIRELADRMQIKSSSQVYGLLRELEDEGLIRRNTSPRQTSTKKRTPAKEKRRAPRRQTPAQLEKAIERVVRNAENKAMTLRDGQTWHLRKDYR